MNDRSSRSDLGCLCVHDVEDLGPRPEIRERVGFSVKVCRIILKGVIRANDYLHKSIQILVNETTIHMHQTKCL